MLGIVIILAFIYPTFDIIIALPYKDLTKLKHNNE
jgi:hypothetical protein